MISILSRLYWAARKRLWLQPVRSPFGPLLFGDPLDGTYQMIMRGVYEGFVYDSLEAADDSSCFLDIGSNIGLFSVVFADKFKGGVLAFEPNPKTFSNLQRNLNFNKAKSVFAICAGIWNTDANSSELFLKRRHSGAASITNRNDGTSVRITTLSPDVLKAIVPKNVQFTIKIDVEGAEEYVVDALVKSGILKHTNRLVIEMSRATNSEASLKTIRTVLHNSGLRLAERHGSIEYGDELYVRNR